MASLRSMITANDSCIDEYYRLAGRSELFERKLRIQSGKLLVRKIAALYHAAMALDVGTPLVWVDWDCAYAPEHGAQGVAHRFWQHVRAHDVTILPFGRSSSVACAVRMSSARSATRAT